MEVLYLSPADSPQGQFSCNHAREQNDFLCVWGSLQRYASQSRGSLGLHGLSQLSSQSPCFQCPVSPGCHSPLLPGYPLRSQGCRHKFNKNNSFWVWRKHPRKNWLKVPEGKDPGRSVDKRRDSWVNREAPLRSIPLDRTMTDRMWNFPSAWWRIEVLQFLKTKQNQGELRVEWSSLAALCMNPL